MASRELTDSHVHKAESVNFGVSVGLSRDGESSDVVRGEGEGGGCRHSILKLYLLNAKEYRDCIGLLNYYCLFVCLFVCCCYFVTFVVVVVSSGVDIVATVGFIVVVIFVVAIGIVAIVAVPVVVGIVVIVIGVAILGWIYFASS